MISTDPYVIFPLAMLQPCSVGGRITRPASTSMVRDKMVDTISY